MRNAVKFYKFLDTEGAFVSNLFAADVSPLSNHIARLNFGQPPRDRTAD